MSENFINLMKCAMIFSVFFLSSSNNHKKFHRRHEIETETVNENVMINDLENSGGKLAGKIVNKHLKKRSKADKKLVFEKRRKILVN